MGPSTMHEVQICHLDMGQQGGCTGDSLGPVSVLSREAVFKNRCYVVFVWDRMALEAKCIH